MKKITSIAPVAPIALDAGWETYGPRHIRIAGNGDGIRFNISINEKNLQGYALDRTLQGILRMVEVLREDGHKVDVDMVETCRAVRMRSF